MTCAKAKFVFFGFEDDLLQEQIQKAKGKVLKKMSDKVTHLIVDRKNKETLEQSQKTGLDIMYLDEFLKKHDFQMKI